MELIKKLLNKITVDNVKTQIENGWNASDIIAKYIIGEDVWKSLPTWDRHILKSRVHKVIRENELLKTS